MAFKLINRSGYDTEDLRRFFARGLAATQTRRRGLVIEVVAAPGRSRGCATIDGRRMVIAIAAPWRFSIRRLARLFVHEAAHIRGQEHKQMPQRRLLSLGPTPRWAEGMTIRYRGRAPNQVPLLGKDRLTRR